MLPCLQLDMSQLGHTLAPTQWLKTIPPQDPNRISNLQENWTNTFHRISLSIPTPFRSSSSSIPPFPSIRFECYVGMSYEHLIPLSHSQKRNKIKLSAQTAGQQLWSNGFFDLSIFCQFSTRWLDHCWQNSFATSSMNDSWSILL